MPRRDGGGTVAHFSVGAHTSQVQASSGSSAQSTQQRTGLTCAVREQRHGAAQETKKPISMDGLRTDFGGLGRHRMSSTCPFQPGILRSLEKVTASVTAGKFRPTHDSEPPTKNQSGGSLAAVWAKGKDWSRPLARSTLDQTAVPLRSWLQSIGVPTRQACETASIVIGLTVVLRAICCSGPFVDLGPERDLARILLANAGDVRVVRLQWQQVRRLLGDGM